MYCRFLYISFDHILSILLLPTFLVLICVMLGNARLISQLFEIHRRFQRSRSLRGSFIENTNKLLILLIFSISKPVKKYSVKFFTVNTEEYL